MKLDKARILITGSSGGIGAALASALKAQGCDILLHGHTSKPILCGASSIQADLTTSSGRNAVIDAAKNFNINVLLNNAGINQFSAFEQADIEKIISVNVIAPMKLTQGLLTHLKGQPSGAIVNVGSAFGQIGFPGYVAYCASKHAVKGFAEALGRELADSSVRVQYISPRATNTAMNDDAARQLNVALGNSSDDPIVVAERIVSALVKGESRVQIGHTESLQVKVNSLFPSLVDTALKKQLAAIKQHYTHATD